jgi:L-lactate utilization protein LutC
MPSSEGSRKKRGASARLFLNRFEEVGGAPLRPTKRRPIGLLLKQMVEELKIETAAFSKETPNLEEITSCLAEAGVRFEEDASKVDLGITGASAAVGKTGGLVFAWEDSGFHLLTSLPPVHLVVVREKDIHPSLEEAIEAIIEGFGYPPPYISVVNGPSKTGDIELIHVNGVHGPQWVYAVVV